jgi:CRISPR/Cas system-associated endoribonuclease Cas2
MAALLVTYDLNSPGQKHAKVLELIKSSNNWERLSESSYVINTSLSPDQVYKHFEKLLDTNDNIWIISLKKPYSGFGSKKVIDWLDNNLTN